MCYCCERKMNTATISTARVPQCCRSFQCSCETPMTCCAKQICHPGQPLRPGRGTPQRCHSYFYYVPLQTLSSLRNTHTSSQLWLSSCCRMKAKKQTPLTCSPPTFNAIPANLCLCLQLTLMPGLAQHPLISLQQLLSACPFLGHPELRCKLQQPIKTALQSSFLSR